MYLLSDSLPSVSSLSSFLSSVFSLAFFSCLHFWSSRKSLCSLLHHFHLSSLSFSLNCLPVCLSSRLVHLSFATFTCLSVLLRISRNVSFPVVHSTSLPVWQTSWKSPFFCLTMTSLWRLILPSVSHYPYLSHCLYLSIICLFICLAKISILLAPASLSLLSIFILTNVSRSSCPSVFLLISHSVAATCLSPSGPPVLLCFAASWFFGGKCFYLCLQLNP